MISYSSSLLSTAYLPPVDFFRILKRSTHWELEKHESYSKQSYRNRTYIYSANGAISLQIPIKHIDKGSRAITAQVIDNSCDWQTNHWRGIESAYNSTPFFLYYKDELHRFYTTRYHNLYQFNKELLTLLLELLEMPSTILESESYKSSGDFLDFRDSIHPKKSSPIEESFKEYHQVFSPKFGFKSNLSIVDLLFNEGSSAQLYF